MNRVQPHQTTQVYDGAKYLGQVRETPDRRRWQAIGPDGEDLGEFDTRRAAGRAVMDEHDRKGAERLRRMMAQ